MLATGHADAAGAPRQASEPHVPLSSRLGISQDSEPHRRCITVASSEHARSLALQL